MKSEKPKKIKQRTKLQIPAIAFLLIVIVGGVARLVIGGHDWTHIPIYNIHLLNYTVGISLLIYIAMQSYYRIAKHRWL